MEEAVAHHEPETRKYDLSERTFGFADDVRAFVNALPKTVVTIEDTKQLVRSSGSIGANYIEADDPLGKKDLVMRMRICRKEAKESVYWLRLLQRSITENLRDEHLRLLKEGKEFLLIFSAIIRKLEGKVEDTC